MESGVCMKPKFIKLKVCSYMTIPRNVGLQLGNPSFLFKTVFMKMGSVISYQFVPNVKTVWRNMFVNELWQAMSPIKWVHSHHHVTSASDRFSHEVKLISLMARGLALKIYRRFLFLQCVGLNRGLSLMRFNDNHKHIVYFCWLDICCELGDHFCSKF